MADVVRIDGGSRDPLARLAERQRWLTPGLQAWLQRGIAQCIEAAGGEPVRRALHGDWLHEPLHSALTDVPVGAWTTAVALDAVGSLCDSRAMDKAADAAVAVGLVGAVGAAVTGMNDWSRVRKPAPRRIGLVHALLNVTATGLFAASAVARKRRARGAGRGLAALGFVAVCAGAHLGGTLVYEHGIGVTAAPRQAEVSRSLKG